MKKKTPEKKCIQQEENLKKTHISYKREKQHQQQENEVHIANGKKKVTSKAETLPSPLPFPYGRSLYIHM